MNSGRQSLGSFLILQSDWNEALIHVGGKAWVSLKQAHQPSVHGSLVTTDVSLDGQLTIAPSEGFSVNLIDRRTIVVTHLETGISTKFLASVATYWNIHKKSITSMDISAGGGLGVTASIDGTLLVWDTNSGSVRRNLDGHVGDVNNCQFFPSGLVVLSGGMDTQVKVWSAEDGSCARTLNGAHRGGILCTATVDRGRNVVSCSRDGSARLWDCGSGNCIACLAEGRSEINCCSVVPLADELAELFADQIGGAESIERSDMEFGTDDKVLVIGCENGTLECLHLATRVTLCRFGLGAPVNSCCFLDDYLLVAGCHDGTLFVIDARQTCAPRVKVDTGGSPVLSVTSTKQAHSPASFWVSFGNGRCSLIRVQSRSQSDNGRGDDVGLSNGDVTLVTVLDLSGPDCDPVYSVRESKTGFVYTSCRDAKVRKYKITTE